MNDAELHQVIVSRLEVWLMKEPVPRGPKPRYKPIEKREPRSGGHNLLPPMTFNQAKDYRKLRRMGLRRGDALEVVGVSQ